MRFSAPLRLEMGARQYKKLKNALALPRNEAGHVFYGFNLVDGCGFMRLS